MPHVRFAFIAVFSGSVNIGIRKVRAIVNFAKKVAIVVSQISLCDFSFEDSSEIWILRESENASAIAIVRTPAITAERSVVAAFSPTIIPRVVITPEVRPNVRPVFIDCLIELFLLGSSADPQIAECWGQKKKFLLSRKI